jgi:hypothetical protein
MITGQISFASPFKYSPVGEISSFDEDGGGQNSLSQEDKLLLSRLLLLLNPAYPASYDGKTAAAAATASR